MDQLITIASQFGIIGLVALAAGWYVYRHDEQCNIAHKEMQERHTQERKEMTDVIARQHTEQLIAQDKSTDVIEKVATAIADLSSLIRDRK